MMAPRSHRTAHGLRFSLAALLVSLGVVALFAGCGLSTGGIPSQDGGSACTMPSQCDDGDPCTTDTCGADGVCSNTAVADGPAPPAAQPQGTCTQVTCTEGQARTIEDDANKPTPSDMCSVGSCAGGKPSVQNAADGTACTLSGSPGVCAAGVCNVTCTTASQCPDMGACKTASCDGATGTCSYVNVSDGTPTPGVTQVAGDCHVQICLGGESKNSVDDSDVPTVPTGMAGCADGVCDSGTPTFPLHPVDSQCSTWEGTKPGFCDAAGTCSQCTQDSECSGTSMTNDCQHPGCNAQSLCAPVFTASGTATTTNPAQIPGDCLQIVCDGSGGTMTVTDSANVPASTNQGCTVGTCNGSTPGTASAPDGMDCGTGLSCSGGKCSGCTTAAQCMPPANGVCNQPNCGCNAFTCQSGSAHPTSPPTTCGSVSDGCGGSLDCDDGKQDGNETDVDCGGTANGNGTCATRCAQGKKCNATSDCASGLTCADGVCCNQACGGACEACTAAKKGQGMDGVCGSVATGLPDPHGICKSQAASTCGEEGGTCNGSGACTTWPAGTVCQPATCAGTVLTKAESCAGGACTAPAPATQNCAPYLCTAGACTTTCAKDADCASGNFCGTGGVCTAKLANGTTCGGTNQCTSGFCADGVCCNSACTAKCQGCTTAQTGGANGTCGNVTPGTPDPNNVCATSAKSTCSTDGNCAAGGVCELWPNGTSGCSATSCAGSTLTTFTACNGSGVCSAGSSSAACPNGESCGTATSCGTTCTNNTTMGCASGDWCSSGTCTSRESPGQSCTTNAECLSDICGLAGSGNCCAMACSTADPTCGATGCSVSGSCSYPMNSTPCGSASCSGGMLTTSACNGMGTCSPGSPTACANGLACNAGGSACKASCSSDSDCESPSTTYCQNPGSSGVCVAKLPNGSTTPCSENGACTSGNCEGGICCNMTCTMGSGPCGATGACNTNGMGCAFPSSSTSCSATSCTGSTLTTYTSCDGGGMCAGGASTATCSGGNVCVSNACNAAGCGTTAGISALCQSGYYCDGVSPGTCQQQGGAAASCTQGYQCTSGNCIVVTGVGACGP